MREATKMFMIKRLLGRGLGFEEVEKELNIKNLFEYMQYKASEFSKFKFKSRYKEAENEYENI
jgi:hypothetical protein